MAIWWPTAPRRSCWAAPRSRSGEEDATVPLTPRRSTRGRRGLDAALALTASSAHRRTRRSCRARSAAAAVLDLTVDAHLVVVDDHAGHGTVLDDTELEQRSGSTRRGWGPRSARCSRRESRRVSWPPARPPARVVRLALVLGHGAPDAVGLADAQGVFPALHQDQADLFGHAESGAPRGPSLAPRGGRTRPG